MRRKNEFIDPQTAKTIAGLFRERVCRTPYACAYRHYNVTKQRFEEVTWEKVYGLAARWQIALEGEGLSRGDRVAIALKNCLEWTLFDLAALGLGLVTVPLFVSDRPENSTYILRETNSQFLLIEDEEQWLRFEEVEGGLPEIKRILVLHPANQPNLFSDVQKDNGDAGGNIQASRDHTADPNTHEPPWGCFSRDPRLLELAAWLPEKAGGYRVHCRESSELATIVYTSGTTGRPKGVMLSHSNILENAYACLQRESIDPDDVFLSFLPLSHTFERTVGYYIPMMAGASVAYVRSIDKLSEDLTEVRPTILISVPRIYERIHRRIMAEMEEKPYLVNRLLHLTVDTGWKRFLHVQKRGEWTPQLMLWPLLSRMVARRVTARLGGRLRLSISGGAPLALPIARIFIGLGLNLLQGYGLTETSPVVSVNTTDDNIPGTVGRLLPGVEAIVATNGELLVRGRNIMLGYWHNARATEAAIDANGYLHTGDVARMDDSGHLTIVGRLKEIIVLSTGEKVPPADIEMAITVNPLFDQVMIVGEGRPYLVALVVLNPTQWGKLALRCGVAPDGQGLTADSRTESILLSEISQLITRFPGYAQIRRVHATFSPWGIQDGLITTTLKLRRKELLARFEIEVNSLFNGH